MTDTHHRKPLPDSCLALSTQNGRFMLKEAISGGFGEPYLELSQVWSTQNDPAYCALGSLVSVLNAFLIDPKRQWKGIWRWYVDEMLDCCRPLESVKQSGITMEEFKCLARCNTLDVEMVRADASSVDQFRQVIQDTCQGTQQHVVVAYSRKLLNQTGDGHFSPIGAYDKQSDQVLIMDVARFKYPSYWVSLKTLFTSTKDGVDKETGKCRGYFVLKRPSDKVYQLKLPFDKLTWSKFIDDLVLKLNTQSQVSFDAYQGVIVQSSYLKDNDSLAALIKYLTTFQELSCCYQACPQLLGKEWVQCLQGQQIQLSEESQHLYQQMVALTTCCQSESEQR